MPKTHVKLYPLQAAVFYTNGEAVTQACADENEANHWIDRMMARHGPAIIACDVFPNLVIVEV